MLADIYAHLCFFNENVQILSAFFLKKKHMIANVLMSFSFSNQSDTSLFSL